MVYFVMAGSDVAACFHAGEQQFGSFLKLMLALALRSWRNLKSFKVWAGASRCAAGA